MKRPSDKYFNPSRLRFHMAWEPIPPELEASGDEKAVGLFLYIGNVTNLAFESLEVSFARLPNVYSMQMGLTPYLSWFPSALFAQSKDVAPRAPYAAEQERLAHSLPVYERTLFEDLGPFQVHKQLLTPADWDVPYSFWIAPVRVRGITRDQEVFSFGESGEYMDVSAEGRVRQMNVLPPKNRGYTNLFVLEPLRNDPCYLMGSAPQREP